MNRWGRVLLGVFFLALLPPACTAGDRSPGPPVASLVNGGFDEPAPDPSAPPGWGSQGSPYGTAKIVERVGASGGKAVELAPSAKGSSGSQSFMLFEILDPQVFRGKKVEYGARVATEGAGVNLVVWSPEGSGNDFVSDVNHPGFMERKSTFTVPANASLVTFGVQVLGPGGGRAWVDDVYLRLAGAPEGAPPAPAPSGSQAKLRIRANTVVRDLPPDFFAMHIEWMEDASGLVEPGTGTPRPDVVELLKPLHIPLLRFPGGIGADFYDWRKGVGPPGERGEIRNPFSKKMEKVAFGSPEFIAFAKALNAKACVTANYGTGSPADAAAWAAWFTEQGFVPKCWEVGNEIYLSGPKATGPNSKDIFKPGAQYAKDFPSYASAIKGAIPDAKVGAIAHLDTGAFPLADGSNPNWTLEMLGALTSKVDFFALHNGYAPVVIDDSIDLGREEDRQKMYRAMFAAPLQTKENLAAMAQAVEQHSPVNRSAPFAITEFGTLVGISGNTKRFLSYVDHTRTQASALYVASLLSVYIGDPRVVVTMYTNPVHKYYGDLVLVDSSGLVTSPTYHLYRFYRERFESKVVATETSSPVFSSERVGVVKATPEVPWLLASASKSVDGKRLTALLVNRGLSGPLEVEASLEGFTPAKVSCELLEAPPNAINGPSLTATVLKNSDVKPKPFPCDRAASQHLTLPPCSILSLVAEAS
jgi:alpha-N-arabinofuranosidase